MSAVVAVGTLLRGAFDSSIEIVQGQQNDVPPPASLNYIVLIPMFAKALNTVETTYTPDSATLSRHMEYHVQIEAHGPDSEAICAKIITLMRSPYGVTDYLTTLYCDDGHQIPFIDGTRQFQTRWITTAVIQINTSVTLPQISATGATVNQEAIL